MCNAPPLSKIALGSELFFWMCYSFPLCSHSWFDCCSRSSLSSIDQSRLINLARSRPIRREEKIPDVALGGYRPRITPLPPNRPLNSSWLFSFFLVLSLSFPVSSVSLLTLSLFYRCQLCRSGAMQEVVEGGVDLDGERETEGGDPRPNLAWEIVSLRVDVYLAGSTTSPHHTSK